MRSVRRRRATTCRSLRPSDGGSRRTGRSGDQVSDRLFYQVVRPDGQVHCFGEVSVPMLSGGEMAVLTLQMADPEGPTDVPCGHAECRASLEVAAACERARAEEAERWEAAEAREYLSEMVELDDPVEYQEPYEDG